MLLIKGDVSLQLASLCNIREHIQQNPVLQILMSNTDTNLNNLFPVEYNNILCHFCALHFSGF